MRTIILYACLWPITVAADASVPASERRIDDCISAVHAAVGRYYVRDRRRDGPRCARSPGALDCYGCRELISEHQDWYDWVMSLQVELTAGDAPPQSWVWYPDQDWAGEWQRTWNGIHATVRIHPCGDDPRLRALLRHQAELARHALDQCLEPRRDR